MGNGTFDYWSKLTDYETPIVAATVAKSAMPLMGAWHLKEVRSADKAALRVHRMRIIGQADEHLEDNNV